MNQFQQELSRARTKLSGGYISEHLKDAWQAGRLAAVRGRSLDACPHDGKDLKSLVRKMAWYEGHAQGDEDVNS